MRPAERAMGEKESEDWTKEIRESYLCRKVVKAQCAVIDAANAVPDDLIRIRTEETFDLAKLFYLDSADAWTVWIALSPANEGKAPFILGKTILASPPLVWLNKGPGCAAKTASRGRSNMPRACAACRHADVAPVVVACAKRGYGKDVAHGSGKARQRPLSL